MTTKQKIRFFLAERFPSLLPLAYKVLHAIRLGPFLVYKSTSNIAYAQQLRKIVATQISPNKQNIHIVLYTHALCSGGAERQWCYLALELSKRGYPVTLLVHSLEEDNAHYLPLVANTEVQVLQLHDVRELSTHTCAQLPNIEAPYTIQELTAIFIQLQASHVLCQLDSTNIMGATAAYLAGAQKILVSFRNVNPSNFPYFYETWMRPCYQELLPLKNLIWTGNSHHGNDDYANWIGMDKNKIHTIHNAINVPSLFSKEERQNFRKELHIPEDTPVILGVFRICDEKNIPLFIEVVKRVHEKIPQLVVLHAGVGPLEEQIKLLIKKSNLKHVIRLLGRRNDIPKLMAAADLLLLTSKAEGLPNVVLEAEAMMLPVVATQVGGVAEAVQEGTTAMLAQSGDAETLAKHCLELLQNSQKRIEMGHAGRKFIQNTFSHEMFGDNTLDLLQLPRVAREVPPSLARPQEHMCNFIEAYSLKKLSVYFSTHNAPIVFFTEFSPIFFSLLQAPKNSICICSEKKEDKEHTKNIYYFDWKNEKDWTDIQRYIPDGTTALFLNGDCCVPEIRHNIHTCGIRSILFFDQGNIYCMPTVHPSLIKRIIALIRKKINL